jgi:hypothetical protein
MRLGLRQSARELTTEFACAWQVRQTYTGKLYGKQDDLCIAMQLSLIGCQKFFQDSKYRNFRAPDYLTPNGL